MTDTLVRAKQFIDYCHANGIHDDDTLHLYIKIALGFNIPRESFCESHCAPFDFISDVFFERVTSALIFAGRTNGKTRDMSIIEWLNLIFKPKYNNTHAGSVRDQADMAYSYLLEYVDKPWYKDFVLGEPTRTKTRLINGSETTVITASIKGFNGPHPNMCIPVTNNILLPGYSYRNAEFVSNYNIVFPILAYNKRIGKLVERWAVKFDSGSKKKVIVKLANGRKIEVSEDHKFLVNRDGKEVKVKTKDLKKGDKALFYD